MSEMSGLKILGEPRAPEATDSDTLTVTEAGAEGIRRFLKEQGAPEGSALRLGVKGGGCSGFSYVMKPAESARADDVIIEAFGQRVFIDPKSFVLLKGITVDFKLGLMDAGFKFINPRASKTCGCGESFAL